jgi:hypothetical protein
MSNAKRKAGRPGRPSKRRIRVGAARREPAPLRNDAAVGQCRMTTELALAEAFRLVDESPKRVVMIGAPPGTGKSRLARAKLAKRGAGRYLTDSAEQCQEHYDAYGVEGYRVPARRIVTRREVADEERRALYDAWTADGYVDVSLLKVDPPKHLGPRKAKIVFQVTASAVGRPCSVPMVKDEQTEDVAILTLSDRTLESLDAVATSEVLASVRLPRRAFVDVVLAVLGRVILGLSNPPKPDSPPIEYLPHPRLVRSFAEELASLGPEFTRDALSTYREFAAVALARTSKLPAPSQVDEDPIDPGEWAPAATDLILLAFGRALFGPAVEDLFADGEAAKFVHVKACAVIGPRLGDRPRFSIRAGMPGLLSMRPWRPCIEPEAGLIVLNGTGRWKMDEFRASAPDKEVLFQEGGTLLEWPIISRLHVQADDLFHRSTLVIGGRTTSTALSAIRCILRQLVTRLGADAGVRVLFVLPRPLDEAMNAALRAEGLLDRTLRRWGKTPPPDPLLVSDIRDDLVEAVDLGVIAEARAIHQFGYRGTNEFIDFDVVVTTSSMPDLLAYEIKSMVVNKDHMEMAMNEEASEIEQQHQRLRPALSTKHKLLVHCGREAPRWWTGATADSSIVTAGAPVGAPRRAVEWVVSSLATRGLPVSTRVLRVLGEDPAAWQRASLAPPLRDIVRTADRRLASEVVRAATVFDTRVSALVAGRPDKVASRSAFGPARLDRILSGNGVEDVPGDPSVSTIVLLYRSDRGGPCLVAWTDTHGKGHARALGAWLYAPPSDVASKLLLCDPEGHLNVGLSFGAERFTLQRLIPELTNVPPTGVAQSLDGLAATEGIDLGPSPLGPVGLGPSDVEIRDAAGYVARVHAWLSSRGRAASTGAT